MQCKISRLSRDCASWSLKAELPIDNADERRRRAQQALDQALQLAATGHFPLGPYRRRCLASALVAIRTGYYDLASTK